MAQKKSGPGLKIVAVEAVPTATRKREAGKRWIETLASLAALEGGQIVEIQTPNAADARSLAEAVNKSDGGMEAVTRRAFPEADADSDEGKVRWVYVTIPATE